METGRSSCEFGSCDMPILADAKKVAAKIVLTAMIAKGTQRRFFKPNPRDNIAN